MPFAESEERVEIPLSDQIVIPVEDQQRDLFLRRFLARGIDLFIAVLCLFLPFWMGAIAAIGYLSLADSILPGQSIGKQIAGIRLVRTTADFNTNEKAFWLLALGHNFAYLVFAVLLAVPLYRNFLVFTVIVPILLLRLNNKIEGDHKGAALRVVVSE